MMQIDSASLNSPKDLPARRMVLLASVTGLGIAVVVAGPLSYRALSLSSWTSSAQAADAALPAGFADLVAKVKPAVISVRVKIEQPACTTGRPKAVTACISRPRHYGRDPQRTSAVADPSEAV